MTYEVKRNYLEITSIHDLKENKKIYKDFTSNLTGTFEAEKEFIWSELQSSYINFNFGETFYPAVYQNDLVIGTNTGGLLFLKNKKENEPTGLENDVVLIQVKVYPNPSKNTLTIETVEAVQVEVVNLLGETILSRKIEANQKELVNVNEWERGFYLVKVSIKGQVIVHKLLLQ